MIKKYIAKLNLFLLLILASAFFLRVFDIAGESIWFDEGFSLATARQSSIPEVIKYTAQDTHPPLYYIILHYWIYLFGDSQFSCRFLSAILGTISVWLIFALGKSVFNPQAGIFAALIMAISRFQIQYSREIRGYMLMVTLAIASYCLLVQLERKKNTGYKIAYILISSALLYTHVYALFIIIAHNIYKIFDFTKNKKKGMLEWFGIQIVLFILYLPWITVITKQFGVVKKGFWISKPEDWRILETLLHFSVSPTGMILMVILCALSPVIIRRINGAGKSGEKILYQSEIDLQGLNKIIMLLIWFATPVLIPFGLSYFITPIYFYRYAIACSPAYYLLCAKGFDNLKIRYLTAGLVTIMVTLGCFNLIPFYTQRQKPDWKEASKYLYANAKENDLMVFSMGLGKNYIFDYYCPDTKLKTDSLPSGSYNFLNIEKYYLSIEDAIELKKKIRGFDRVWIVLYLNTNPNMIIERTMSYLSYKLIEIKDFSSSRPRELTDTLRIYQFEKKH